MKNIYFWLALFVGTTALMVAKCANGPVAVRSNNFGWVMSNGPAKFAAVYHGDDYFALTNWEFDTNAAGTERFETLRPALHRVAAPGQLWCWAINEYEHRQEVTTWAAETNNFFGQTVCFPERHTTNDWPQVGGNSEIVEILSVEDGYAHCWVREWSDTSTAFVEGKSVLLLDYLTNKMTLVKE